MILLDRSGLLLLIVLGLLLWFVFQWGYDVIPGEATLRRGRVPKTTEPTDEASAAVSPPVTP